VPVDPGKQKFVFELPGNRQRTVEALIVEGEKSRVIALDLPPPDDIGLSEYGGVRPPPPPVVEHGPRPLPLVLAGVGAAGLGGFAGLALSGWRQEQALDRRCAPRCTPAEVQAVRRKYHLADASLAVGVGALAVAGYLYLRGPSASEPAPALTLALDWWRDGGLLAGVARSF
jgi:hypothetical protein